MQSNWTMGETSQWRAESYWAFPLVHHTYVHEHAVAARSHGMYAAGSIDNGSMLLCATPTCT